MKREWDKERDRVHKWEVIEWIIDKREFIYEKIKKEGIYIWEEKERIRVRKRKKNRDKNFLKNDKEREKIYLWEWENLNTRDKRIRGKARVWGKRKNRN